MRTVLAMLVVASSAAAAPPGATPPVVHSPAMTAPQAPPVPPKPTLMAIDLDAVPAKCKDLGERASSQDFALAESARVSLALCTASDKTTTIAVCDCEQSVKDLDEAVAPAFAILDELANVGEPTWQVIALHAKADVLDQLARRVENALPVLPPDASSEQQELRDVRLQMLRPMIEPWRTRAQNVLAQVVRIAKAHPEVGKNQLADQAVRDSRRRLAPAVSSSR